jgi:hypothetical protein
VDVNPEKLTILNAKTVKFEPGSRGIPVVTWETIAGGLAKCSDFQYALIVGKWAGDEQQRHRAFKYWLVRCYDQGWHLIPGIIERFAATTLAEYFDPRTCVTCNGVGEVKVGPKVVTCEACQGAKVLPYTERRLAMSIRNGHKLYEWNSRVDWAREQLADEEQDGLRRAK